MLWASFIKFIGPEVMVVRVNLKYITLRIFCNYTSRYLARKATPSIQSFLE